MKLFWLAIPFSQVSVRTDFRTLNWGAMAGIVFITLKRTVFYPTQTIFPILTVPTEHSV